MAKLIKVNTGKVAIVDDDDFVFLSKLNWFNQSGYPARWVNKKIHFMHWEIMGRPEKGLAIDHVDGNSFNNCRDNLRVCSYRQNMANKRPARNKLLQGLKGVREIGKGVKKYRADIKKDCQAYYLGTYLTPYQAAQAYNQKAKEFWGEFAWLNKVADV